MSLGADLAEACEKARAYAAGLPVAPKGVGTVGHAAERWVESYVRTQRNEKGRQQSAQRVRDYVEPFFGHKIQGLKSLKEAYVPGIFDKKLVDEKVNVADDDAFETTRRAARIEGMLLGMSAGASLYAALDLASRLDEGVIAIILPDFGERYLSTSLFAT